MNIKLPSPAARQWLYGIATTVLPLLVVLKILQPSDVPLWLALIGAVLGTAGAGTAYLAVSQQRRDGVFDESGRHARPDDEAP